MSRNHDADVDWEAPPRAAVAVALVAGAAVDGPLVPLAAPAKDPFFSALQGRRVRNATENHYIGARLRERKAQRARLIMEDSYKRQLVRVVDELHATGLVRSDIRFAFARRSHRRGAHGRKLVLCVKKLHGKRVRHAMSIPRWLEIGFHPIVEAKKCAVAWGISDTAVRIIRRTTAKTVTRVETNSFDKLRDWAQDAKARGADTCMSMSLAFDGTDEKLNLKLKHFKFLGARSWHVLISKQQFSVVEVGKSATTCEMLRPPVPCMATSAESLDAGLNTVPQVKQYAKLEQDLEADVTVATKHFDSDGGANNWKCIAHMMNDHDAKPSTLLSAMPCGNHNEKLCELSATDAISMKFIAALYSIALLFKMGSYYLRLVLAVSSYFGSHLPAIIKGSPPPAHKRFTEEVGDYIIRNFKAYSTQKKRRPRGKAKSKAHKNNNAAQCADADAHNAESHDVPRDPCFDDDADPDVEFKPQDKRVGKGIEAMIAAWQAFTSVFNALPLFVHYCDGPQCCQNYNAEITRKNVSMYA